MCGEGRVIQLKGPAECRCCCFGVIVILVGLAKVYVNDAIILVERRGLLQGIHGGLRVTGKARQFTEVS